MLFQTITKKGLAALVDCLVEDADVIGPKRVGVDRSGKPVHHFEAVERFDELDLDYEVTELSAKTLFLPFEEALSRFRIDDADWEQQIEYHARPQVVVGLHPCDINGLLKLDKVFTKEFFPSPYYVARRRSTVVIGLDHMPCEGGFCRSLGTDTVTHGFDLYLTDIGDRYFVAVATDKGYGLARQAGAREVTAADRDAYTRARQEIGAAFAAQPLVSMRNLPNLMDLEATSPVWKSWGDKCLSCGSCAMVCPTCYCYDVSEHISMDFSESVKQKRLYSCNLVDFALVAGGHNFRPDRHKRLMYRYYHQHRGFVDTYGEPKCVGCNRCGRTCVARIQPADVIRSLQAEELPWAST